MYRLFSWEHSYFSGKVRAYLRFKANQGALGDGFEDILATPELLMGLLNRKSGTIAVPQLEAPDGTWIQDSSEILDYCEARHEATPIVPDAATAPRQRLAAYLIEFLADEWMVVPAFWQRWYYTEDGHELSHRAFNEQQFGAVFAAGMSGNARRSAGAAFFEDTFGISDTRVNPKGVYAGLVDLGCNSRTEHAWQASQHALLESLEAHFSVHDYVLGGRPSLADYGLIGPLYAHLYRDAVPGFYLRARFPLTTEWVERTNGEGALNARCYGQKLYHLDESGELVGRVATSDGGDWLPDDQIPETLMPILAVFFREMWPVLRSAAGRLRAYVDSDAHTVGDELPGKTFFAHPGFETLQRGEGSLTHSFEIGGIESRRMVIPYQIWMWQRVLEAMATVRADPDSVAGLDRFVSSFEDGQAFFEIDEILGSIRILKKGGQLFSTTGG